MTVWSQAKNDSLPHHTDYSLESTSLMLCYPMVTMDSTSQPCGAECVATKTGHGLSSGDVTSVSCCCTTPLCNHHDNRTLNITLPEVQQHEVVNETSEAPLNKALYYGLGIAGVIGFLGTVGLIAAVIVCRCKHSQFKQRNHIHQLEDLEVEDECALRDALTPQLDTPIAQGRYARVCLGGEVNGVAVVIKCFTAAHKKMWQQEKDIYRSPGMNSNSSIARFFGATQTGTGNDLTMWIVLQYYPHGSIYDYLKGHTLTWPAMLKLAHSMMSGLAYLHDEQIGPDVEKRSLAHRDIKSKNILIKDDMTAAIADFGLAQYFKDGSTADECYAQAGTHRYMAPEVLDGAISFAKDAFLRIDIYAAALVMWELLTRCDVSGNASLEYKAPYEEMESTKYASLLETLQSVVSKEKKRPTFPACLYRNRHAASLITTIEESWDGDAEARLSAGCVESRLQTLLATSTAGNTELNNMRNLDPPPYEQESSPLIPYGQLPT